MKHDDTTLQAAIDAAMLEIGEQVSGKNFAACPKYYRSAWPEEADDRLDLAKAFLAKLPEPILADDGRSLGQVAYEGAGWGFWDACSIKDKWCAAAQAVVAAARPAIEAEALAAAVRRMEAVPKEEIWKVYKDDPNTFAQEALEAVRARLIAAAKGKEQDQDVPSVVHVNTTGCDPMTEETAQALGAMVKAATRIEITEIPNKQPGHVGTLVYAQPPVVVNEPAKEKQQPDPYAELKVAQADGKIIQRDFNADEDNEDWRDEKNPDWKSHPTCYRIKPKPDTFEAHGKTWTRHTPGDPMPCEPEALVQVVLERELDGRDEWEEETNRAREYRWGVETDELFPIVGWRYADVPDSTDWKARAEKAEAELTALKSSQIGILRPLSEAGPVPDGCVRVTAFNKAEDDYWVIGDLDSEQDTHFAIIRLPVTDTPAQTVNEPPIQQVPLGPEDVPPGSVFQCADREYEGGPATGYHTPICVHYSGVLLINSYGNQLKITWPMLKNHWFVNTSIPLTGKWDANAWQSCYKLV